MEIFGKLMNGLRGVRLIDCHARTQARKRERTTVAGRGATMAVLARASHCKLGQCAIDASQSIFISMQNNAKRTNDFRQRMGIYIH